MKIEKNIQRKKSKVVDFFFFLYYNTLEKEVPMVKTNLPVILLRGIILLPHNHLRLEFENDDSKNIIDVSEMFHDNKVLVISGSNPLEETMDVNALPKIGVIAEIRHKITLPNEKVRVVLHGLRRVSVNEYLNLERTDETLESIVEELEQEPLDEEFEKASIHKLYIELENYVRAIPYMSNSVLSEIINVQSLDKVTDIVVPHMPVSYSRMMDYLKEIVPRKRMEMILEDIYQEKEMFEIEKKIDNKVRNEMDHAQKEYLIREKIKYMKEELGDTSSKNDEVEEFRLKIENLNVKEETKERFRKELRRYEGMSATSPETNVQNNYLHWITELPWNIKTEDETDLSKVRSLLEKSHSGLEKVKERILEYLAVSHMTNSLNGPILCLVGPPGVGKTTLAISIAEAMGRKFAKMSVGGVRDEAEIMGHRRAYVGASPGRIISSIKKAGSSNPLFLIDEIDKMTRDREGDPASALLEILDPEQNKFFSDHYIEEEFDLSDVLFITTANYIENIPEPLRDRMEVVNLTGYTEYEKLDIAKKHLIPKICKSHGLDLKLFSIDDNAILTIIREYTKESGVRELERMLSKVVRKLVTKIVMKESLNLHVKESDLENFLGKKPYPEYTKEEEMVGVVNGLAYTSYGGDTLPIEVNFYKGEGKLHLTGSLGDVMKESAHIAFSYVKANHESFGISYEMLTENDIHIHVPEGAVPKDGPSAGIALTTAIVSALTNTLVEKEIAMTGEITLRGHVLPIGGVKEKSIGAMRNHIKKIYLPKENLKDLEELPKEVKKEITFIPVSTYEEVWKAIQS